MKTGSAGDSCEHVGCERQLYVLRFEKTSHPALKFGYNVTFEPGVATQPQIISRAGMGHGEDLWPILPPVLNIGCYGLTTVGKMPGVGILADNQSQPDMPQTIQQQVAPGWRALWPRWKISGLAGTRITKPHGQDGELLLVIEGIPGYPHPLSKPIAAGIIEGQPGFVHSPARGLPDHQNSGAFGYLYDRPWPTGQNVGANRTGPHASNQVVEGKPAKILSHECSVFRVIA